MKALLTIIVVVFTNPEMVVSLFEDKNNQSTQLTRDHPRKETDVLAQHSVSVPKSSIDSPPKSKFKYQIASVANQYEKTLRYPMYSLPIDENDTHKLQTESVIPVNLNLGGDGRSSASLKSKSFVYFHGETIEAKLSTQGPGSASNVIMELVDRNQPLQSFEIQQQNNQFVGRLHNPPSHYPVNLQIRATFKYGSSGHVSVLAPIKYSPANGVIKSVGKPYVDGVNLAIPVELDVQVPGRYRMTANLFDQHKKPLAHLSAKQKLVAGKNTWVLNVHSQVLRDKNAAGPYILDTWQLIKMPQPGVPYTYGKSDIGEVKIEGFPLKDYDDTPWADPNSKKRLMFLRKISG